MLALDRAQRAVLRLVPAPLQVGDLACRGVQVHGVWTVRGSLRLVLGGFWRSDRVAGHAPQASGSGRYPVSKKTSRSVITSVVPSGSVRSKVSCPPAFW